MKRHASIGELFAKKTKQPLPESTADECSAIVSASSNSASVVAASNQQDNCDCETTEYAWPASWTRDQWLYFRHEIEWLICNNGQMGCSVCVEVGSLGVNS